MKPQYVRREAWYRAECDDDCGWGAMSDRLPEVRKDARWHAEDEGHTVTIVKVLGWFEPYPERAAR